MEQTQVSGLDSQRAAALKQAFAAWAEVPAERVLLVRSPYRFCPLGAHVDHQLGEVTGMALDRALLMAFAPTEDGRVVLKSRQFPGVAEFPLDAIPPQPQRDWADYGRGAAMALSRRHSLRRGVIALLDGHDNVEGLSSSAATGVAYLLALEAANGLALPPEENVELDRIVENDYVGLNNGILDQSVILMSRPGHLTHIDCLDGRCRLVPLGGGQEVSVAVLFSGLRRPLAQTDYNRRVAECAEAAAFLLRAAGLQVPARPRLRAVPRDAHLEHAGRMPERLRRRAEHFFSEQERVRQGLRLWRAGDLDGFGRLMSESGRSSIENYECGNAYLRAAYEALRDSPGVFGARFSGAGFRGCCVGLARPECEGEIARSALSRYVAACPDMAGKAEVYFCRPGRAAQLLP